MPASASPLLQPPYAGVSAGSGDMARRSCGCYADPLVFDHFHLGGCEGKHWVYGRLR